MEIAEVEKLADVHGSPAVSILCRLDRRRSGNLEDPLRIEALRKRAVDAVLKAHDERSVAPLLGRLEGAVSEVDLAHPSDGVAIFVTENESHVFALPFPVVSRVVVGDSFAIPDLVRAAQQTLRVLVLVLAAEQARAFESTGHSLQEIHGHGFPFHISPPVQEDTPHRDLPIGEREKAEAHKFVLRAVETAVAELQAGDRRPIVVIAPVRELAYFDEVTAFGNDIIGRVHGNYLTDSLTEIELLVEPTLTAELDRRSAEAVQRATEAVGTGAATGFAKVAAAALVGRGHELIIEENLRIATAPSEGPDDPVDEIIDAVFTHDGRVTIVPTGTLGAHGGIVLILRY